MEDFNQLSYDPVKAPTAKIPVWILGENWLKGVEVFVGAARINLLGFDALCGQTWELPEGTVEFHWAAEDTNKMMNQKNLSTF